MAQRFLGQMNGQSIFQRHDDNMNLLSLARAEEAPFVFHQSQGQQNHWGQRVRERLVGIARPQPTNDEIKARDVRDTWHFERKLNVIVRNPEMFRRYKQYAIQSEHFSPTGLCYVLNEFMDRFMKISNILEDIEREGEQSRYDAYIISALDDFDTETITFDCGYEDLSPYPSPRLTACHSSPLSMGSFSEKSMDSTGTMTSNASRKTRRKYYDTDNQSLFSVQSSGTGISLPSLDPTEGYNDDSSMESISGLQTTGSAFAFRFRPVKSRQHST
jgi:hypothetical protein